MILTTFYYYLIGYLFVTIIASLHFLFNWKVLKQGAFDTSLGIKALLQNATQFESFQTTKPFHPLYNLIIFPFVSRWMFQAFEGELVFSTILLIGFLWLFYCFLSDVIFWVLIPHPWRLTWKDLFVTYQPWIFLAYVAIAISPILTYIFIK